MKRFPATIGAIFLLLLTGCSDSGERMPATDGREAEVIVADVSVPLPGGRFSMGTDPGEFETLRSLTGVRSNRPFSPETPRHEVTLAPFSLHVYDVTNGKFLKFVETNPEWRRSAVRQSEPDTRYLEHWSGDTVFDSGLVNHPVTFVTWYAAVAYCKWRGKRLPTEAEWEYASGAGIDDRMFPWGDDPPSNALVSWSGNGIDATVPVGSYPPNDFGLYDMSGNVWKFLADSWRDTYTDEPASDLSVEEAFAARDRTRRVVRGGSWGASAANLRVRYRDSHRPWDAREMVGFRCAGDSP